MTMAVSGSRGETDAKKEKRKNQRTIIPNPEEIQGDTNPAAALPSRPDPAMEA